MVEIDPAVTRAAREAFQRETGNLSADEYLDNDIIQIHPPWWGWDNLGPEWKGMEPPTAVPGVRGNGSYNDFRDQLKMLRDHSDKYILAMIYGSHFEKANGARSIENFLADMAGEPAFAQKLLDRIIDRNMVMLENFLGCPEIDGVLLQGRAVFNGRTAHRGHVSHDADAAFTESSESRSCDVHAPVVATQENAVAAKVFEVAVLDGTIFRALETYSRAPCNGPVATKEAFVGFHEHAPGMFEMEAFESKV